MSPQAAQISAIGLLVKINVITGWIVPADEELADVLTDQFAKKIQESYADVNADEVEYAFRTYGTTVKDWGKSMNLSLIDEVMSEYLAARREVSRFEEQKQFLQIEHKEDTSDNAMKEWFDQTARDVQSGKLNLEFVPPMLYDWMAKTKQIPDCKDFYKAAALKIGQRLAKDMTPEGIKEANNYRKMWKAGEFTGKYVKEIENLSKSIVIWNHILKGGK